MIYRNEDIQDPERYSPCPSSKITKHAERRADTTHNAKTNQTTKTNPELTQMLESGEKESKIQIELPEMKTTMPEMKSTLGWNIWLPTGRE